MNSGSSAELLGSALGRFTAGILSTLAPALGVFLGLVLPTVLLVGRWL